jgi:circadian clock protein KaiC
MEQGLRKTSTGITGLDEITGGGLPRGRATLVCGGPGCGKTLLATGFLAHGASNMDEPGVLISFDERAEDLEVNSFSLGFDLADLRRRNLLAIDFVHLDRNELEESGAFDLEGLFVRINLAVTTVGAKRIVLDTVDTLFAGLPNEAIVRSELRRLFRWLRDKGLTTIITAERGERTFTRHGIEEYVSDCVILLDHRVNDEISTRRLRVVKYRGSTHGTNEYPFLISEDGISVLPVTSLGLAHKVSSERLSTGIAGLDDLLEKHGYFRGSSVLVSGGPGTGKTSVAMHFVDASCSQGEKCLYLSFEESPQQLIRNMRSIGLDPQRWMDRGLLRCSASRPTEYGLETHLALIHKEVTDQKPSVVVIDPISALIGAGEVGPARAMVLRLIDYLKSIGTTSMFSNLQGQSEALRSDLGVSSLMDTWLLLTMRLGEGRDDRQLQIIKSRGMAHPLRPQPMAISATGVVVGTEGEER